MRKSRLKYKLLLLLFLFCANTMGQSYQLCGDEGWDENGNKVMVLVVPDPDGEYALEPNHQCLMLRETCITNNDGTNDCEFYKAVPLGSGILISCLFVLGYGSFVCNRRKKGAQAV